MFSIAWGAKVSRTFIDRAVWIVDDLSIGNGTLDGLNKLMTCIAWESGRTFSAKARNMAGSGATGLIQFMPATARGLGTTTEKLAKMTPEDQLNYVWKYFAPYKGKLKTLADLYMAILWPKAVGKPEGHVLWTKRSQPTTFRQNAGLDKNRDSTITKGECAAKVEALLNEGLRPGNVLNTTTLKPLKQAKASAGTLKLTAADEVAPMIEPLAEALTDVQPPAEVVIDTAERTVTVTTEAKTPLTKVQHAISGWQGNFAGIAAIVGALMLNPEFAAQLGRFTVGLSKGEGGWGALVALIGAGLIAYKRRPNPG